MKFQDTFRINCIINSTQNVLVAFIFTKYDKYTEKQIIMVVQATPKTHPGGVQGALLRVKYQLDVGPLFINKLPRAKAPKFRSKNSTKYFISI